MNNIYLFECTLCDMFHHQQVIGRSDMIIQYISSYPPSWRPFLHPQPENAPCRGGRDPLIMIGVDGRIILRWIFRKSDVLTWNGSSWLRIGTGGGHL